MNEDAESLKRVLETIRAEARKMKAGNMSSRLNPKPEAPPSMDSLEEKPAEGKPLDLEVKAEAPEVETEEKPDAAMLEEIKRLIARC